MSALRLRPGQGNYLALLGRSDVLCAVEMPFVLSFNLSLQTKGLGVMLLSLVVSRKEFCSVFCFVLLL